MIHRPWLATPLLVLALGSAGSADATSVVSPSAASAQDGDMIALESGAVYEGELDVSDLFSSNFQSFTIDVPEHGLVLKADLVCRVADLDLYITRFGDDDENDPYWFGEVTLESEMGHEHFVADRFTEMPLVPGTYNIDVLFAYGEAPIHKGRRLEQIPYTLEAQVIESRIDAEIEPGQAYESQLDDESGRFRTYKVRVPRGAKALRVDISGVGGDVDIMAQRGRPIINSNEFDHAELGPYGRETMLLTEANEPPLSSGPWFIDVVESYGYGLGPSKFTIEVSFDVEPPQRLLEIPKMVAPQGGTPVHRAMASVVEVFANEGSGSGTILTPDGLVLTNAHVVEDLGGLPLDEVAIAITTDPGRSPIEMFRGKVVEFLKEQDLALVQIDRGYYNQPLPKDYVFPHVTLGDSSKLEFGQSIWVAGFPATGGQQSRATLTLATGIVAGFESMHYGAVFKTDAEVHSGNSGGATLDERGRLIGVPTSTTQYEYEELGYLHPPSLLGEKWIAEIKKRAGR